MFQWHTGRVCPSEQSDQHLNGICDLSGLTCNWENATTKAGAQRYAAQQGLILVMPDTSPRGEQVPNDEAYDFGQGAGFYLNATQAPWSQHFRMYDYIVDELPKLVEQNFPVSPNRRGLTGHSMGGHGALTLALKNPDRYTSVSAFSPIVAPSQVPWGQKAFQGYLGDDQNLWAQYDATVLIQTEGWKHDILIDQGTSDNFLEEQLQPQIFATACEIAGVSLNLRQQEGYDHSYYFIASFIGDHIAWHTERLQA